MFKQYRGSGKPHGTFERPNVKYNQLENRGNGIIRPGGADVRYPTSDEIPK
nr:MULTISPECIES: hypothetical protein [Pseudomonas syringae group]